MKKLKTNRMFRLFCGAAFLMILCVLILSATWYVSIRHAIQEKEDAENKRELSLLNYSINTTNEDLRILSINTFYHALCQEYITAENGTPVKEELLLWLRDILRNHAMIRTVELYNNRSQTLLAVTQSRWEQSRIRPAESSFKGAALLRPIPCGEIQTEYFQYFMYDSVDRNGVTDGALVFRVEKTWLSEILDSLNLPQSRLVVLSRVGQVIAESPSGTPVGMVKTMLRQEVPEGSFEWGGLFLPEYVVSYLTIPNSGWRLVSIRPYRAVYRHLYALARYSIAFVGSVVLFILVIGGYLLHRSREPLKLLSECVIAGDIHELSQPELFDDEITQLRRTLYTTLYEQERLNEVLLETEKFFQDNLLKMLLRGEVNAQTPLIRLYVTRMLQQGKASCYLVLCVRRCEGTPALPDTAVRNLEGMDGLERLFQLELECAVTTIVLQFSCRPDAGQAVCAVLDGLPKGCRAAGSRPSAQVNDLAVLYQETMSLLLWSGYEMQKTSGALPQVGFRFPHDRLDALMRAIENGKLDAAMDALSQYLSAVPPGMNDMLVAELIHLTASLDGLMTDFDPECRNTVAPQFQHMYESLRTAASVWDVQLYLQSIVRELVGFREKAELARHSSLISEVKKTIEQQFSDTGLSLKGIAQAYQLSDSYLGKLFRKTAGISVADYITQVRLEHAVLLLVGREHSVREIMQMTGFENESTFYRLFKKWYGVTPGGYAGAASIPDKRV